MSAWKGVKYPSYQMLSFTKISAWKGVKYPTTQPSSIGYVSVREGVTLRGTIVCLGALRNAEGSGLNGELCGA
jgi:hypothetical protein